jgi:hypothetical protein
MDQNGPSVRLSPRLSANMRARLQIPEPHRNLSRRPAKPALGRGRLQVRIRRAFWAYGGEISTSTGVAWSYRALQWGAPRKDALSRAVRHALISIGAVKVRRSPTGRGRPWIWRLRNE